jgi:phosphoribosylanthranilate isomerase
MTLLVKICGLKTAETMAAALDAGADMVGLVLVQASPRHVPLAIAAELAEQARDRAKVVALMVNPDDEALLLARDLVGPHLIQLHGQETPERVRDIAALTELPIMKAVGIASRDDLPAVQPHAAAGARILLDAKPPKDAAYPGGHGKAFDWDILAVLPAVQPFMLSGGLSPENVGEAITRIDALGRRLVGVDVSSGVETAPGLKDVDRIRAFVANARQAHR